MRLLEVLKKVAIEFCSHTSLHGMQYTVEPRRALIERLFWRLAIFGALVGSVLSFRAICNAKYFQSQVITSIVATSYPTFTLEQPAITICNANRAFKSSADRFFKTMNFHDESEKEELQHSLPKLIEHFSIPNIRQAISDRHMIMKWTDYLQNNGWTLNEFMLYLSQKCSDMIVGCTIGMTEVDCSDIVSTTRTGLGFCCSVAYMQNRDALLVRHAPESPQKTSIPFVQSGYENGLSFLLNLSQQDSTFSEFYKNSAAVFIHSPMDFPSIHTVKIYISDGAETFSRIKSTGMLYTPGLEDLDPISRQCYMEDEIKLKYFDHYTFGNCFMENHMELLISRCNCLKPQYPNQDPHVGGRRIFITINGSRIPCLERCVYSRFSPAVTVGRLDGHQYNTNKPWNGMNVTGLTVLHTFQQSFESRAYKRTALVSHWRKIVVVGGLAGVVFGLNLLNIVEFIYFLTSPFFSYLKKQFCSPGNNKKVGIDHRPNVEQKSIRIFVTSRPNVISQ
ncbi:sodium channel protein Nach-like isoform X2 [Nilaparvata lugens]|uniref:sodium channel protein Nach-like isoform X2 n=1 Tax=Nilaparvata lugens TaxID=108931 RepID=UPI00193EBF5D|nr:sodium channel protein Nach-like isoform X2 [Nilaparvata lugens]